MIPPTRVRHIRSFFRTGHAASRPGPCTLLAFLRRNGTVRAYTRPAIEPPSDRRLTLLSQQAIAGFLFALFFSFTHGRRHVLSCRDKGPFTCLLPWSRLSLAIRLSPLCSLRRLGSFSILRIAARVHRSIFSSARFGRRAGFTFLTHAYTDRILIDKVLKKR
jgi:hypothetical protein